MSEMTGDKNMSCDLGALSRFLGDQLADEQRLALEDHLSDCAECRTALERLAAEPAVWTDTRDFLSSADDLAEAGASSGREQPGPGSRAATDLGLAEQIVKFLSPTDDPRMLGRFGGYEIAGVIGCGGMAVVVKGLDVALNRYVAIKVLAPHLASSAAARQRFAREARAAAAVVHENVTAIHSVSEANGLPYLVMPYVRGSSLQKRLDAQGPFTTAEVLRIGTQTAAALAAAHAQGLVHRDIKPANILLEDGVERLTITDFGLARAADDASLTRSGVIAGTPQFMSPEQARGEPIDARSDLFSLGSVLYTLCTGRAPFRAETTFGVLRRISDDTPRPIREINPDVPEWLVAIIGKLHAKDRAARYQSAEDVARLLEECLAHVQQPMAVPLPGALAHSAPDPIRGRRRLRRWLAAGAAICGVIALAVYAALRPPAEKADADRRAANQAGAGSASAAGAGTGRTAPDSFRTNWIDGTEQQIFEAAGDIEALDAASATDWDATTPALRSKAETADDADPRG